MVDTCMGNSFPYIPQLKRNDVEVDVNTAAADAAKK